jgi:hypothetical protein
VRLRPEGVTDGYGACSGEPLVEVTLLDGPIPAVDGDEIWRLTGEVELPDGPRTYDQRLLRTADGALMLRTDEAALSIPPDRRSIVVEAPRESLVRQLVTTYGFPLVLDGTPTLVLHGCAVAPPDEDVAYIVCGRSGSGKSSLLVGLVEAGWRALSEDVSVVDLRDDPAVWPGPPWVRRTGEGPTGASVRFRTPDKTAWDIEPWRLGRPVRLGGIGFLEAPGGPTVAVEAIDSPEAIRRLARSTVWLLEPGRRAAATFEPSVRVAQATRAFRLRFPLSPDWVAGAAHALESLGSR